MIVFVCIMLRLYKHSGQIYTRFLSTLQRGVFNTNKQQGFTYFWPLNSSFYLAFIIFIFVRNVRMLPIVEALSTLFQVLTLIQRLRTFITDKMPNPSWPAASLTDSCYRAPRISHDRPSASDWLRYMKRLS